MAEQDCVRCPHPLEDHRVPIDRYGGYEYGWCRSCDCERIIWPHSLDAASFRLDQAVRALGRELIAPFRRLVAAIVLRRRGNP